MVLPHMHVHVVLVWWIWISDIHIWYNTFMVGVQFGQACSNKCKLISLTTKTACKDHSVLQQSYLFPTKTPMENLKHPKIMSRRVSQPNKTILYGICLPTPYAVWICSLQKMVSVCKWTHFAQKLSDACAHSNLCLHWKKKRSHNLLQTPQMHETHIGNHEHSNSIACAFCFLSPFCLSILKNT